MKKCENAMVRARSAAVVAHTVIPNGPTVGTLARLVLYGYTTVVTFLCVNDNGRQRGQQDETEEMLYWKK